MELSTGKILEENLVLKHKAKSKLELLTKPVNVPEWPSYSFDLNLRENIWQELKLVV
jgi:hypothetical protein